MLVCCCGVFISASPQMKQDFYALPYYQSKLVDIHRKQISTGEKKIYVYLELLVLLYSF